jgi:disulfide oxidoreductase YuzD
MSSRFKVYTNETTKASYIMMPNAKDTIRNFELLHTGNFYVNFDSIEAAQTVVNLLNQLLDKTETAAVKTALVNEKLVAHQRLKAIRELTDTAT